MQSISILSYNGDDITGWEEGSAVKVLANEDKSLESLGFPPALRGKKGFVIEHLSGMHRALGSSPKPWGLVL